MSCQVAMIHSALQILIGQVTFPWRTCSALLEDKELNALPHSEKCTVTLSCHVVFHIVVISTGPIQNFNLSLRILVLNFQHLLSPQLVSTGHA